MDVDVDVDVGVLLTCVYEILTDGWINNLMIDWINGLVDG